MNCVGAIDIRCEYCGTEYSHATHHVVMKKEDPNLAADIVNDEFFYAVCPHCNKMTGVDHPVVYFDVDRKAMIAYFDSPVEFALAQQMIDEWAKEFSINPKQTMLRIVSTQNELREKVILVDNSLDDRVIEILKLWALDRVRDEGNGQEFEEMRCSPLKDGSLNIDFVGDEPMHIGLTRDYYDRLSVAMQPALNREDPTMVVSTEWAIEFDVKNRL